MDIYLMTNTYYPIVGGLERSIDAFSQEYRRRGNRAIIVAPHSPDAPLREKDVVRVPALPNFNHTDFAVKLPVSGRLNQKLESVPPDIVHAQHPFFIGDTALRTAYRYGVPLIFTHHTLYEMHTHYMPGGGRPKMACFVKDLATGYANMADRVFAPSKSVKELLLSRGVRTPIDVVPTGIDLVALSSGRRVAGRERIGVPQDAFLAGYAGRLAEEKNLEFLSRSVSVFLREAPKAYFVFVGVGPMSRTLADFFEKEGLVRRVIFAGVLQDRDLADMYAAMDVFAFASQSETQGLALLEAMACGVPAVALDACAVRDVVFDRSNGILVPTDDEAMFVAALNRVALDPAARARMSAEARRTADTYSIEDCASRALDSYQEAIRGMSQNARFVRCREDEKPQRALWEIRADWKLLMNFLRAAQSAMHDVHEAAEASSSREGAHHVP